MTLPSTQIKRGSWEHTALSIGIRTHHTMQPEKRQINVCSLRHALVAGCLSPFHVHAPLPVVRRHNLDMRLMQIGPYWLWAIFQPHTYGDASMMVMVTDRRVLEASAVASMPVT